MARVTTSRPSRPRSATPMVPRCERCCGTASDVASGRSAPVLNEPSGQRRISPDKSASRQSSKKFEHLPICEFRNSLVSARNNSASTAPGTSIAHLQATANRPCFGSKPPSMTVILHPKPLQSFTPKTWNIAIRPTNNQQKPEIHRNSPQNPKIDLSHNQLVGPLQHFALDFHYPQKHPKPDQREDHPRGYTSHEVTAESGSPQTGLRLWGDRAQEVRPAGHIFKRGKSFRVSQCRN
jgi:hypothetical protein